VLWAYQSALGGHSRSIRIKPLVPAHAGAGWKDEEPGPKTETQLGRAFRELGIEWIAAHSPQAKGRVERCFGTLQDRLLKGLRIAGAATLEGANRYLVESFLPEWNARLTIVAACDVDARAQRFNREHSESRRATQVNNDYTIAWGPVLQIPKQALRPGLRRSTIRIERPAGRGIEARIGNSS
jgi:hypothetical protein